MSKQRKSIFDLNGVNPTAEVSKHLSKKGHLKGSKKEIKNLRSICTHHVINRRGKTKPRIEGNGHGKDCRCKVCRREFPTKFYTQQEYDKAYDGYRRIISQGQFVAVAVGANMDVQRQIASTALYIDKYGKLHRNLQNVASKQAKGKNKKEKRYQRDGERIGRWNLED